VAGVLAAAASTVPVAAEDRLLVLDIARNSLAPAMRTLRVRKDDAVTLEVKADRALVLHIHGLNLELVVGAGASARMSFTARATGRFPVEVHAVGADRRARHHGPPLAFLEVMPK
jgi:hypothetical protein